MGHIEFDPESPCIWTKGMTRMECPVRHGEGKYVMPTSADLDRLASHHQLTVRYVDPTTAAGEGMTDDSLPYPVSPNGSMRNIAGICDSTGLVFDLCRTPKRSTLDGFIQHTLATTQSTQAERLMDGKAKASRCSETPSSTSNNEPE